LPRLHIDAKADGAHTAGSFNSKDIRIKPRCAEHASPGADIHEVNSGSGDLDLGLTRARHRVLNIAQSEHFGAAGFSHHNGFHRKSFIERIFQNYLKKGRRSAQSPHHHVTKRAELRIVRPPSRGDANARETRDDEICYGVGIQIRGNVAFRLSATDRFNDDRPHRPIGRRGDRDELWS
jgi:hypothetical protein